MKDFRTAREIDVKEAVLVVGNKVYARESYISVDTSKLKGYPPRLYYDKDEKYLGKMFDKEVFELEDIEDILIEYQDQCFSNHDLDDLREFLIKRREVFYKNLSEKE